MLKTFNTFPVGSLPYDNEKLPTRMMVRLFVDIPYLPLFSNIADTENLISRTLNKIPNIIIHGQKLTYCPQEKKTEKLLKLETAYKRPNSDTLEPFGIESFFMEKYFQILKKIKPKYTVINFLGAFTILNKFLNSGVDNDILENQVLKFIIQVLSVKALWIIQEIQSTSPETKPIILFEDSQLHNLGKIKRENEVITRTFVIELYKTIAEKIHRNGGLVAVQCFNKCDWSILFESGIDMISFGAYSNPSNLCIYTQQLEDFLKKGGLVNWGIVPVKTENQVKNLSIELLQNRLINIFNELVAKGVNKNRLLKQSTISVQGDLNKLEIFFAEKALILSKQIADRLAMMH